MCLIATTKEPLIATEDIKVYKVVFFENEMFSESKNFIRTPYRFVLLTEYSSKINELANKGCAGYIVSEQGIHAYSAPCETYYSQRIITGIIPKGTKYWTSENGVELAAEHIKFDVSFRVRFFMFFYDMTKRIRYKFRNML